jgi:hypothetical protein
MSDSEDEQQNVIDIFKQEKANLMELVQKDEQQQKKLPLSAYQLKVKSKKIKLEVLGLGKECKDYFCWQCRSGMFFTRNFEALWRIWKN